MKMSRVSETQSVIDWVSRNCVYMTTVSATLPILSQIALSLATIADHMTGEEDERNTDK